MEREELTEEVFMAIGEISAVFMSQEIKGVEMIMPSERLKQIGEKLVNKILKY